MVDAAHRATEITITNENETLLSQKMGYDAKGNLSYVDDLLESPFSRSVQYTYDNLDQIQQAVFNDFTIDYESMGSGNLTARNFSGEQAPYTSQSFTFGQNTHGPHQLSAVGDTTFEYDAAGRTTRVNDQELRFNTFDNLTEVILADQTVLEYFYGPSGQKQAAKKDGVLKSITFDNGIRYHHGNTYLYVNSGGKILARLPVALDTELSTTPTAGVTWGHAPPGLWLSLLVLMGLCYLLKKPKTRLVFALIPLLSCGPEDESENDVKNEPAHFDDAHDDEPLVDAGYFVNDDHHDGGNPEMLDSGNGGTSFI